MTEAEQILWSRIRRKQVLGLQVFRQKPIGFYIADFYTPKAKLVIEVDGSQHLDEKYVENDLVRSEFLESWGLKVLRFTNSQVLTEMDKVMEIIGFHVVRRLKSKPDDASPKPSGGILQSPPFVKRGI
jgi:very-short-patch-repair endonuclease